MVYQDDIQRTAYTGTEYLEYLLVVNIHRMCYKVKSMRQSACSVAVQFPQVYSQITVQT